MPTLEQRYRELNREQRLAVDSQQNTLVKAGPGSGKTRIITVKAGLLNIQEVGVTCLSFNRAAAKQISEELQKMHIYESGTLFVGTVHSFCLEHVLHKYLHILDYDRLKHDFGIASVIQAKRIETSISEKYGGLRGYNNIAALRRAVIVGNVSHELHNMNILHAYDSEMNTQGVIDFEMIVEHAVAILRDYEFVRKAIEYQFRWFLIDEYQDLGGGLHSLVLSLLDRSIKFLVVGDRNQLIYDFSGANEVYFTELEAKGFLVVPTVKCYRFGSRVIEKSNRILGKDLIYEPSTEVRDTGDIVLISKPDNLQLHANYAVLDLLPDLSQQVEDLSQIAILFRRRKKSEWDIVDCLIDSFAKPEAQKSCLEAHLERSDDLLESPIIDWLCKCAAWALPNADPPTLNNFPNLIHFYRELLRDAGNVPVTSNDMEIETGFQNILLNYDPQAMAVKEWIQGVGTELRLGELLRHAEKRKGDLFDLRVLFSSSKPTLERKMSEIALDAGVGKVVVTTMHKSKGREFDYVILPAIDDGMWDLKGSDQKKDSVRRLLYVACTRAKKITYVLHHPGSTFA